MVTFIHCMWWRFFADIDSTHSIYAFSITWSTYIAYGSWRYWICSHVLMQNVASYGSLGVTVRFKILFLWNLLCEKQRSHIVTIGLSRKWPFVIRAVIGSQTLLIEDGFEIRFCSIQCLYNLRSFFCKNAY